VFWLECVGQTSRAIKVTLLFIHWLQTSYFLQI
jgi:hypothetical protein